MIACAQRLNMLCQLPPIRREKSVLREQIKNQKLTLVMAVDRQRDRFAV